MKIVMPVVIGSSMLAVTVPAANAAGVCSTTTPQYCPAPVVTTGAATSVTAGAAVLNGTVNPNGAVTTCAFSYAVGAAPATTTPAQTIAAGTSPVAVTAQLTGLTPKTTYSYELICVSGGGFGAGSAVTFTTLAGGSRISIIGKNGKVSSKRILSVRLKCTGGSTCKGTVTLRAKANGKGKKLASKSFRIGANKRGTVKLKVSKATFKTIKHHPFKAKETAKMTGGNTASAVIKLHR